MPATPPLLLLLFLTLRRQGRRHRVVERRTTSIHQNVRMVQKTWWRKDGHTLDNAYEMIARDAGQASSGSAERLSFPREFRLSVRLKF